MQDSDAESILTDELAHLVQVEIDREILEKLGFLGNGWVRRNGTLWL